MIYVILSALLLLVICGWVKNRIALLSIIHGMKLHGFPAPNEAQTKASTEFVIRHLFKR